MVSNLRVALIFTLVISATVLLAPIQIAAAYFAPSTARKIPLHWHRAVLWLNGTRVATYGKIPKQRPLLIVSNHVSWSDIMVLGSVMELCFIAKSEVKSLPGLNILAFLQRTVFVERGRRSATGVQADSVAARLLQDDVMVLFAEGTTNDGLQIYPFKSALFGAAERALKATNLDSVHIQPVTIAYTHQFGMPLGRYHQTQASWPGDIPLGSHFMNFFRKGSYDVSVIFGETLNFDQNTKRRKIAARCHEIVSQNHAKVMSGRLAK